MGMMQKKMEATIQGWGLGMNRGSPIEGMIGKIIHAPDSYPGLSARGFNQIPSNAGYPFSGVRGLSRVSGLAILNPKP